MHGVQFKKSNYLIRILPMFHIWTREKINHAFPLLSGSAVIVILDDYYFFGFFTGIIVRKKQMQVTKISKIYLSISMDSEDTFPSLYLNEDITGHTSLFFFFLNLFY